MGNTAPEFFLVKLSDSRILGPFSVDEIRELILNQTVTTEAQFSPDGQFWSPILKRLEFEQAFKGKVKDTDQTVVLSRPKNIAKDLEVTRSLSVYEREPLPVVIPVEPMLTNAAEKTREIQRPAGLEREGGAKPTKRKFPQKRTLLLMVLVLIAMEALFEEQQSPQESKNVSELLIKVRPRLPQLSASEIQPGKSQIIFDRAVGVYVQDTIDAYQKSVEGFELALRYDPKNQKALAMLASAYLNLLDAIDPDEKVFSVIAKLIQLSKVSEIQLNETLVAETEYLLALDRTEQAKELLFKYNRSSSKFDPALNLLGAQIALAENDPATAKKWLDRIPENTLQIPKYYWMRGRLAELTRNWDEADFEYREALKINPKHAKSMLGLARIHEQKGNMRPAARAVEYLIQHPELQTRQNYIETLRYRSKIAMLNQQRPMAVMAIKRALELSPRDIHLKLQYYVLLAQAQDNEPAGKFSKLYSLLLQANDEINQGRDHEALTVLIQAKDAYPSSAEPYTAMGDYFLKRAEFAKAETNYRKAFEIQPKDDQALARWIHALIESQAFEEAKKAIALAGQRQRLKSSTFLYQGRMAEKQNLYATAYEYYRKAMNQDTVDPDVYFSVGEVLRKMDDCDRAPFFYVTAERLSPGLVGAKQGIAWCLLKTDSATPAISYLQKSAQEYPEKTTDFMITVGEILAKEGDLNRSEAILLQVIQADPRRAEPHRILGDLYYRQNLRRGEFEKKAVEQYKLYSEKNPADPYGYFKRFDVFVAQNQFSLAQAELDRILSLNPSYPELRLKRGLLFEKTGRLKEAIAELEAEVRGQPKGVPGLIQLGRLLGVAGRFDDAIKALTLALQLNPQSVDAKLEAGQIYYLKRQFQTAVGMFRAAMDLDRGRPEVYKRLGLSLRAMGDIEGAREAFKNYTNLAPEAPDRKEFLQ